MAETFEGDSVQSPRIGDDESVTAEPYFDRQAGGPVVEVPMHQGVGDQLPERQKRIIETIVDRAVARRPPPQLAFRTPHLLEAARAPGDPPPLRGGRGRPAVRQGEVVGSAPSGHVRDQVQHRSVTGLGIGLRTTDGEGSARLLFEINLVAWKLSVRKRWPPHPPAVLLCTDVTWRARDAVPGRNRISLHSRPTWTPPVKKVVPFPEVSNRGQKDPSAILRR